MIASDDKTSVDQYRQNCQLCEGTLKILTAKFLVCTGCGLMLRRVADDLKILYTSGWQSPLENLNLTGGTTPALGLNYSRELLRTLGKQNLNGMKILDFGGGRGELARALRALGASVVIADPYSYSQLREQGLAAVESLDQLEGSKPFDGAVTIDVVEHLTAPWEQLRMIKGLLVPGGWLYLSTPNAWSLNARINRENWREALNPSHLLLFAPPAMDRLLRKAGFEGYQRLRWRVDYSENKLVQAKDWLLRSLRLDGVLRYMAYS